MKPLISVIIPVYNVEKYLARCLDSVLAQTFTDYELICINDGSTDASNKILLEYEKKDSRIQVVQNEKNSGLSFTRNAGFNLTKGKYVYFLDSDDAIDPDCLQKIYDKAEETNSDIVIFGAREIEEGKKDTCYTFPQEMCSRIWNGQEFFAEQKKMALLVAPVPFKLWRKDFLIQFDLHFYEGIYHEDELFTFESLMCARCVALLPDMLYLYYRTNGSIMRQRFTFKHIASLVVVIDEIKNLFNKLKNQLSGEVTKAVLKHIAGFYLLATNRMKMFGIKSMPETLELFDDSKQNLYDFLRFMALRQYNYSFSEDDIAYIKSFEHLLVYGAGKISKKIIPELMENNVNNIELVVTSKTKNLDSLYGIPVKEIRSLDYPKDRCVVIVAVGKALSNEVLDTVAKIGYKNFIHF